MLTPPSRPHILTLCGGRPPPQELLLPLDTNNPNPDPNPEPIYGVTYLRIVVGTPNALWSVSC